VHAVAQIKLKSDPESILTSSEQERSRLAPFATPPNRRFSVRGLGAHLASSNDLTETPCTDGLYIVLDLYVSSSVETWKSLQSRKSRAGGRRSNLIAAAWCTPGHSHPTQESGKSPTCARTRSFALL
jgi:hypothetical protein